MASFNKFFSTNPGKLSKQGMSYTYINVGHEPFHALAVALIDQFKNGARVNEVALKKILERFYAYYPKYISNQAYLTVNDRMNMLMQSSRPSELVECMANVLRQLSVDELYANPLKYRESFEGLDPETSKTYMRQSTTVLPVSALNALTKVLGITIVLSFTEYGKELRKREVYTDHLSKGPKLEVQIQVQGDLYFPGVKNKSDFAYVGQLAITPPKPVEDMINNTGTIGDMLDLIAADDKRLLVIYEHTCKTLLSMVAAGELSMKNLMDLYVKFLPTDNTSLNRGADFFSKLRQSEPVTITGASIGDSKQKVTELLAESLASWIGAGLIESDELFEFADTKLTSSLSR